MLRHEYIRTFLDITATDRAHVFRMTMIRFRLIVASGRRNILSNSLSFHCFVSHDTRHYGDLLLSRTFRLILSVNIRVSKNIFEAFFAIVYKSWMFTTKLRCLYMFVSATRIVFLRSLLSCDITTDRVCGCNEKNSRILDG